MFEITVQPIVPPRRRRRTSSTSSTELNRRHDRHLNPIAAKESTPKSTKKVTKSVSNASDRKAIRSTPVSSQTLSVPTMSTAMNMSARNNALPRSQSSPKTGIAPSFAEHLELYKFRTVDTSAANKQTNSSQNSNSSTLSRESQHSVKTDTALESERRATLPTAIAINIGQSETVIKTVTDEGGGSRNETIERAIPTTPAAATPQPSRKISGRKASLPDHNCIPQNLIREKLTPLDASQTNHAIAGLHSVVTTDGRWWSCASSIERVLIVLVSILNILFALLFYTLFKSL